MDICLMMINALAGQLVPVIGDVRPCRGRRGEPTMFVERYLRKDERETRWRSWRLSACW